MPDAPQLAPCPFCGSTAIVNGSRDGYHTQARCGFCFAAGPSKLTRDEAIAAWNQRAPAARLPAELAKLRGKLLDLADYFEPNDRSASAIIREAVVALLAMAEENERLRALLGELTGAEATYRRLHDLHGDADSRTGRAWDLMRRAGDAAHDRPTTYDICQRLRAISSSRQGRAGVTTNWHRNPDGPEAAALIEEMAATLQQVADGGYDDLAANPARWACEIARTALAKLGESRGTD